MISNISKFQGTIIIMKYNQFIKLYYYAKLTGCNTLVQLLTYLEQTGQTIEDIILK